MTAFQQARTTATAGARRRGVPPLSFWVAPMRHGGASLSATVSGSFCLATSLCFGVFRGLCGALHRSRSGGPTAKICSTCVVAPIEAGLPPHVQAWPAAWPRSATRRVTASCTTAAWPQLACFRLGFLAIDDARIRSA